MIGLIPFLIDRFATEHCGPERRALVFAALDRPPGFTFKVAKLYDDDFCRDVITGLVAQIGLPMDQLYDHLGRYFLAWLHDNLGAVFADATDTATFLTRLPAIYNSFGGTMAEAGMAQSRGSRDLVSVRRSGNRLTVTYRSRMRFAEFYASFMRAVAVHYDDAVTISVVAGSLESAHCVFDVTVHSAVSDPPPLIPYQAEAPRLAAPHHGE